MGMHRQVGGVDAVELGVRGVGVDQRRGHPRHRPELVAVGQDLAEAHADGEDQVGLAHQRLDRGRLAEAGVAGVARAGVVEEVLAAEADEHRQPARLGEGAQARAPCVAPAAASGDDQRRLARRRAAGRSRRRPPAAGAARGTRTRGPGRASVGAVSTSSGSATTTGPGRPVCGDGEGAGDDLGDAVGVLDLGRPLGERRRRRRGSRPPGTPRARASPVATWPTKRIIGEESCRAVCTPIAALVAPGPRVTKQMPGRPVSLPQAAAMKAAPPSWRFGTSRTRRVDAARRARRDSSRRARRTRSSPPAPAGSRRAAGLRLHAPCRVLPRRETSIFRAPLVGGGARGAAGVANSVARARRKCFIYSVEEVASWGPEQPQGPRGVLE